MFLLFVPAIPQLLQCHSSLQSRLCSTHDLQTQEVFQILFVFRVINELLPVDRQRDIRVLDFPTYRAAFPCPLKSSSILDGAGFQCCIVNYNCNYN